MNIPISNKQERAHVIPATRKQTRESLSAKRNGSVKKMAAIEENSDDNLWNSSVCSKSWAELVEDEEEEEELKSKSFNGNLLKEAIHNSPLRPSNSIVPKTIGMGTLIREYVKQERKEVKIETLNEDTCDTSVTRYRSVTQQTRHRSTADILPNFSCLSSQKDKSEEEDIKTEAPKEFLNDDISLTGHLNGFKLVSPRKTPTKTPIKNQAPYFLRSGNSVNSPERQSPRSPRRTVFKTPTKTPTRNSVSYYLRGENSDTKLAKRKIQNDDDKTEDDVSMPSPSKIRKQNTPKVKETPPNKEANRKRSREITPAKSGTSSEKKTPRDLEPDSDILSRRQKQIDYGKNTIGYDRYRQLVPKDARAKMHPRTPPLQLKFSRRAWDGLIRVWRQRLHFWDPPSEGGGNPESLEFGVSDISDTSSTDGSMPNTPVQDKKRQRWAEGPAAENLDVDLEEDDDQGCTPLPPE